MGASIGRISVKKRSPGFREANLPPSSKVSPKVIVVMGSISDRDVMTETAAVLRELDIPFEMGVYSAHRTPERSAKLASEAASRGVKVLIAGAGAAAGAADVEPPASM